MPKEKGKIVLWAEYFDRELTRKEGRRVPKKLARSSPKVEVIQRTARDLGYNAIIDPGVAYPRHWWKRDGRVLIHDAAKPKSAVILEIAEGMKGSE